jgi:ATP-binding protein involved in chromosome partitioning
MDTLKIHSNDITNLLKTVPAPFLGMDIVAAGMVLGVEIGDTAVSVAIEMKIPSKSMQESLAEQIRQCIRTGYPGLRDIAVNMSENIYGTMSDGAAAFLPGVKNTIAVASGKGGVGKSTVAVNIAVSLAREGARVGLIDADIYGPSIPTMMAIYQQPTAYKKDDQIRMLPCDNYGVKVMSIGFLIEPDSAVIWRGPMASGALKQFLTDVDWGELDYLIFDMPPGTGDIQLTLSQSLPLTGAVIVTTPQDISLADARKGIRMFERVSVPILGIIENMSYYVCSHCGNRDEIFSHGGGREAADELRVPFLGEIPLTTRVRQGGDQGIPIVELEPDSLIARSFVDAGLNMAGHIAARVLQGTSAPAIDISLDLEQ